MTDRSRPASQRLLALLLALLLCLPAIAVPAAAQDGGNGEDNLAQSVNQKDGSSVFDFAFEVRRVSSGVVDQTNAAVAYANCEACQTVAIAVQIVLVSGGADTITPTNVAIAINESCVSCQTLALAYQFVFGTGQVLEFTKEGRKRLKEIQKEFEELGKSDLSVDDIRLRAGELALEIGGLLATELVPRHPEDEGEDTGSEGSEDDACRRGGGPHGARRAASPGGGARSRGGAAAAGHRHRRAGGRAGPARAARRAGARA